jgi:hypothetical protein
MAGRSKPKTRNPPNRVIPLELLFDLVFAFAVSQLSDSFLTTSPGWEPAITGGPGASGLWALDPRQRQPRGPRGV